MLLERDLRLAKKILIAYEVEFYPNKTAETDIKESLFWDHTRKCFSADWGFLLRGDAEEVRIYESYGDLMNSLDSFDAEVVRVNYKDTEYYIVKVA